MKKILSMLLTLVMVVALFSGCGSKESDSTYFKELQEMSKIKKGTSAMEMSFVADTTEREIPKALMNADGKIDLKLKMEAKTESETKQAVKLSVKMGKNDYQDFTTIVLDGTKLYLDVVSIVDTVKSFDKTAAAELDSVLQQMGITGNISLDLKQVAKAFDITLPDNQNNAKKAEDLMKGICEKLEKHFEAFTGKDGDNYTLTVNGDNAEKVVDAWIQFSENDMKQIYKDLLEYSKSIYGADSQIGKQYEELEDTSYVDDMIKEIKDNRDETIKGLKDSKVNIVSKISVTGDEGSREAKFSLESGDISFEEDGKAQTGNISMNCNIKEEDVKIADMIPENVMDITSLLIMMVNEMNAGMGE